MPGTEPPSSSAPARDSWRLRALHSGAESAPIVIPGAGLTIGRDESNDVTVSSAGFPGVSGTHARVSLRDGAVRLEDLGAQNGTWLRGERVTRTVLEHGDVFELGRDGPRFVVLSPSRIDGTVVIPTAVIAGVADPDRRRFGTETVEIVRARLGIPPQATVDEMVRRHSRRNTYLTLVVVALLLFGGAYAYRKLAGTSRDAITRLEDFAKHLAAAESRIAAHRADWMAEVARSEAAERAWADQRAALEADRARIHGELALRPSAAVIEELQRELAATNERLQSYDPINLEQTRLGNVSRAGRAVVMVLVEQTFHEPKTGRRLYIDVRPGSATGPNLEGRGQPYTQESSGSGFCFTSSGWILTNAHVVLKKGQEDLLTLAPDLVLEPRVKLEVIFSGTRVKHEAALHAWATDGMQDLALIKIAPFPEMPHLPGIDTALPRPPVGSEVILIGFPLGKQALQQGDVMIASAFRGIVSRSIESYIQVDAAVHPGNSGGPVIDDAGRVIGVVVGMQRIDRTRTATSMGYIIPIELARDVWPPATARGR